MYFAVGYDFFISHMLLRKNKCTCLHLLLLLLYTKLFLQIGGSYMKLEAEFRDQWAQTYKNSSTGKNTIRLKK